MGNAQAMVELIRARGIHDAPLLAAMLRVPRERFVAETLHSRAYGDYPLPIGYGQTISQPYIVAVMTHALEIAPGDRVLEIGTGSGYQTAILAELGAEVYTLEVIPALRDRAEKTLTALGYANLHFLVGDGHHGWPEHAPYQGILAAAAATAIPPALLEQLAAGGTMVIPVGPRGGYQTLWKVLKRADESIEIDLGSVAFVPFVRSEEV